MPANQGERFDFFLSRRGSVAAIAREVADVLTDKGYKVLVQDYDAPIGESFIEMMHKAIKNSRDLVILFTRDYEQSSYTRKEFTSFEAQRHQSLEERHIIVLRCEDAPVEGLLADNIFQDLAGITDPEERKRRIIAAAERQSLSARPPPRPFIGVPPRIASFTGRAEELDRLDAILMRDKPAAVTQSVGRAAVQGLGGVGKTSLATEYAHRYRQLYAGVCWCPAETRTGLLTSLAGLAVTLGAATPDEADVEKAAKAALRRLSEQRATWLLVYDNITSPDEIVGLLPSDGARVLITSRFSDWSECADEVSLDVLPLEEAIAFLKSRAGRKDADGARTLAEALGHLPLALDHAAAYCKRTQMPFVDYAAKATSLIAAAPRGVSYPRSVAATFDLAITEAVTRCAQAKALMAFLAHCAPERISLILVEGAVEDEGEWREALAALAEVSLVKHDPFEDGTWAVTVHRLVQAVARAHANANATGPRALGRLFDRLVAVYPSDAYDNPASWPPCAPLTPHLLASCKTEMADSTASAKCADLLVRAGSYFHGRAAYSGARALFERAMAIREKVLGPEHSDTAESLGDLALLLHHQGDLAGPRSLFERALAICEKVLGPEHPDTTTILNNLGVLLQDQGDFVGARSLFERVLAIREKVLGPEHPQTATILNNLALLLQDQGNFVGARALFERALVIREKVLHPDTANSLNNLASLLTDQGDLAGARPLFERALAISEKVLGPEHPSTATSLGNLAKLLQAQGDLARARLLYERALAIDEKMLGPEHPQTATILNNLALLLQDQGDFVGARALYERALAIWEKVRGLEHPSTNRTRRNLATVLLASGNEGEALAQGEAALAAHNKALGPTHPWTKDSARVTADALDALGRTDEAAALRERYGLTQAPRPL